MGVVYDLSESLFIHSAVVTPLEPVLFKFVLAWLNLVSYKLEASEEPSGVLLRASTGELYKVP